ncbi:Xyloglucan endotransglucosylase/hydrolase protein 3 [Striga hermonthica]|uniref:Xyloglucan endotransglucosylase/hydrolase protein 3 n=1 Tax=Striga hermonthica TaxID=68872 RepID=A0A9N7RNP6_STRHE|nr:Xyloglucan endotransglucosylase/hydrolase protein 3 [Striga hermonthica]
MYLRASLWNGTQWLGPVDWSQGPFFANYRQFEIIGCPYDNSKPQDQCMSSNYPWNAPDKWQLDPRQQKLYEDYTMRYKTYDYCMSKYVADFPECMISS